MKRSIFLLPFLLFLFSQGGAQTPLGKFNFECVEGDTLYNGDVGCWFCDPTDPYILYGLKITQPSSRIRYIRRPYLAEVRQNGRAFVINYERDSTLYFDTTYVDMSKQTTAQQWVDIINNCPAPPIDSLCCKDSIDLFQIVGDTLQISISDDTTIHEVLLDICCNDCSFAVFRQYFPDVTGDSVVVTVNGGSLPFDPEKVWVMREGNKQIESQVEGDTLGDYVLVGSVVRFNYWLEGEDVEVWFLMDTLTNNGVDISRQYFLNTFGTRVTPAAAIPSNPNWVKVFVEGEEQHIGNDYLINGAHIDFVYYLDNEDVEVWAMDDVDCDLRIFKEWFTDVTGTTVTISGNNGILPVLRQTVAVFVEGWKEVEGSIGDYQISGDTVTFNYSLDGEDVEVWYIIGGVDVGFLGQFLNP